MSADPSTSQRRSDPPALRIRPPADDEQEVDLARVLHAEEVSRARVFFRVALAISLLTAAFIPLLEGARWMRITSAILCLFISYVAIAALLRLRRSERYTPGFAALLGVLCGMVAVAVIHYIGPFSAGAIVLMLGISFFGMSHSRLAARVTYATIALLYLVSSAGIASGALPDEALFRTTEAQPVTRWFQVIMSQAIFALTFYLSRSSRRAMERAIERMHNAHLEVRRQHALLVEAKSDLARAMRPGEGRYSGQKVGGCTMGTLLGRGAMGEVYRGVDAAGMPVAIKLLHSTLVDSPTKVKRFLREAEAASAVDSPHVPKVFGSGFLDDGTPYLVMELLEGHDLGWHLRQLGKLPLELVVEMCEHVARALADVRDAGVVHRDLKPANLFLTDSLPRTWKVLDFGLSKIMWEAGSLTRDTAVGTPSYMPPEQVRGGSKIDHHADLYALAAIAYRAITGIPPFTGNQVAHVLYRVVYQQPVCPGELVPIPVDIELVLAIGMAKDPSERFSDVESFARAMKSAYEGRLDDDTRARGWALIKRMPWGSTHKPLPKSA